MIAWAKSTFPKYRKQMKGVDWGGLYNRFKGQTLNPAEIEKKVAKLMADDDVTRKAGIYPFVLDADERHLSIRAFTDNQKTEAYERQKGVCPVCSKHFALDGMEADHITPWRAGGKTIAANCQMLCKDCNRRKSGV